MRILRLLAFTFALALAACIPAQAQVTQNSVFDVSAVGPHYLIKGVAAGSGTTFAWTFKVAASQAIFVDLHFASVSFTGPITITTSAVLDPLNFPGGNQHAGGTLASLPCQYGNSASVVPVAGTSFTSTTIAAPGDIIVSCSQTGAADYIVNFTTGGSTGSVIDLEEATSLVAQTPIVQLAAAVLSNDPCTSNAAKITAVVNVADGAGTSGIITGVAGKTIYPCVISINAALGTSSTVQFEYGTGASCTSPQALTGVYETFNSTPNMPLIQVAGLTVWAIPTGQSICAVNVGAQQGVRGFIGYVQQ